MISYQKTANRAKRFLYTFYSTIEAKPKFPIMLEKIVDYLSYKIAVESLPQNVNAITDMVNKIIYVSKIIDPTKYPRFLGRYKFTLAHEIAHIILHEEKYLRVYNRCVGINEFDELKKLTTNPYYEKEADIFAGNLILPRDLLKYEFRKKFGETKIFIKDNTIYPAQAEEYLSELQKITEVSKQALQIALKEIFILRIIN